MWLEDFWNTLTGQRQEDARTQAINDYNLQQVRETNQANKDIARMTNETNLGIARENLGYQRELQEYNKALQEQIFQREDTSYQRTVADMLKAGLNPLTMQGTNGAGEAIAMSPLNNQFQAQQPAAMQAHQAMKANMTMSPLQAIGSVANGIFNATSLIDSLMTGSLTRDRMQLENQSAALDNLIKARRAGVGSEYFDTYIDNLRSQDSYDTQTKKAELRLKNTEAGNAEREYNHKVEVGKYDSDSQISELLTDLQDWLTSGRGDEALASLAEKYPGLIPDFLTMKTGSSSQREFLDKHPNVKKIYKALHKDAYYNLYPEEKEAGTKTNSSNSSNYSGKF